MENKKQPTSEAEENDFFDNKLLSFVSKSSISSRIATVTPTGAPHISSTGFIHQDDRLYIPSLVDTKKIEHLQNNSSVAFEIDISESTVDNVSLRGIIVEGKANLLFEPSLFEDIISLYYQKYSISETDFRRNIMTTDNSLLIEVVPSRIKKI
ncbi:MAG: pyridoxamine 5'-phosphate oxidase family protein [Candidatus Heimdallarchaeota archaeon]|nr:pyridoxamine 5'-phosphate oxidase family protein [Candidatus Heimdallarchaeota archaeon]MCK5049044.1 pyridoxamine 5'-phosphate oxidase family protein [Candidatus Heimdallarchaeota archaeon]